MKKSISQLGITLNKVEQKQIIGGNIPCFNCYNNCIQTSADRIELAACYDACHQSGIC